ncbi:MAG: 6-hydroxynicotinate reductase, partial [Gammaproteobacteria bacterium]
MTEHTKTDGLPVLDIDPMRQGDPLPEVRERARPRNERMASDKIECNACPVLCQISPGKTGACDRYANSGGVLVRVDPVVLLRKALASGDVQVVPFAARPALANAGGQPQPANAPVCRVDELLATSSPVDELSTS